MSAKNTKSVRATIPQDSIVKFVRQRDYKYIRELGQGACGLTVLLRDEEIGEDFVCKKYTPYDEAVRADLFANFVREVVLLHKVFHPNVVRVYNYYLYKDQFSGYIIMEHVDGLDIEDTIRNNPELADSLFLQAIDGFDYLETIRILHRDIRTNNILVTKDGVLKIIDLGFGKRIEKPVDFDKSISLTAWCAAPEEFKDSKYDFQTEVYFVGKLFEKIITENNIESFSYHSILAKMCQHSRVKRIQSFAEISRSIQSNRFTEIEFTESDLAAYREFSDSVVAHIPQVENGSKFKSDITVIQNELEVIYRSVMLEYSIPDCTALLRTLIDGNFYVKRKGFSVSHLRSFIKLLRTSSVEQRRIIIANLHTRLDSIGRYFPNLPKADEDVPF